ncbi:MAG TPA: hypothetical protein DCL29_05000 [Eubacterium sp.]|nr:hypothetical protein [Eubacterium sp.]
MLRYDGPVMMAINKITDYVWMTILCLVCSLPIFTIGASVTAKYYVAMKYTRGEDTPVTKAFFKAFKQNFKQCTFINIIAIIVGVILYFDWALTLSIKGEFTFLIELLLVVVTLIYFMSLINIFLLISRFEIKTKEAVSSGLAMSVRYFGQLMLIVFIMLFPFILIVAWNNFGIKWGWLIWLFSNIALTCYVAYFYDKEFTKIEEKNGYYRERINEDKYDSEA